MHTLHTEQSGIAQFITLHRPQQRNAMSLQMVDELLEQLDLAEQNPAVRALVLRGSEGHFSAGADLGDMLQAQQKITDGDNDAFFHLNRRFGELLCRFNSTPLVVIAALEGAVIGGGFGLACVADIAIASDGVKFSLPETRLGLLPAQIAPFVVARIGESQARRLALSGSSVDIDEAWRIGLVHQTVAGPAEMEAAITAQLQAIGRCAPGALAATKRLLLDSAETTNSTGLAALLDRAAHSFSAAVQGNEGAEGTRAFIEKRPAAWQV